MPPPEVMGLIQHPFPVPMRPQHVRLVQEVAAVALVAPAETDIEIIQPEVETHYPEVQVFTAR